MHFEIEYTLHVVNIHSGFFDENVINKASAEQLLTARHDSMHQQRNERSEKLNEMNQFVRMLCCQRDALASFFLVSMAFWHLREIVTLYYVAKKAKRNEFPILNIHLRSSHFQYS